MQRMIDDGIVLDVSDACIIEVNPLQWIRQTKHYFFVHSMIELLVACRLKYELEMFDHPGDKRCNVMLTREDILKDERYGGSASKLMEVMVEHEVFNHPIATKCGGVFSASEKSLKGKGTVL